MALIGLNITVSGYTGKLIIRWVKASSVLSEIGRSIAFNFPYSSVYAIPDLDPVVYIVQMWRSSDGVALSELIKSWEIDASLFNVVSSITYQYKVGRGDDSSTLDEQWADPADLDTTLFDERLIGYPQSQLYVVEAGYGPLLDSEYEKRTPDDDGINLLGFRTFNQDTSWFITVFRIVTQEVNNANSANQFAGTEVITADTDFYTGPSDNLYNKLVIVSGALPALQVSFPALNTIPDNTRVTFNTHNSTINYLSLQFNVGDTIVFQGESKNVIYIPRCEEISLFFYGDDVFVVAYGGNAKTRGNVIGSYKDLSDIGPYLKADQATGLLDKADYEGLYEWINSLPVGVALTTLGAWNSEKTRWYIDIVGEHFRVPHLAGMFTRFVETTEFTGVYQADGVGPHKHGGVAEKVTDVDRGALSSHYSEDTDGETANTGTGIIAETRPKNTKLIPLITL